MTTLSSLYTLNAKVRETPYTELHRGYRNVDGMPVFVKLLSAERPTRRELALLRHEYELLASLNLPQIVKAVDLSRHGHGLALVMEDPGDLSLDRLIRSGQLDLRRSLELAVAMAQVVAAVHEQHIVHKDIQPQHFFVRQEAPYRLVLADLGIATRLSQHIQEASEVGEIEGTLAYIAPEQTGRMNRVVDWRSDLYSLGVSLYELFTDVLPFETTDPIELVHCHIARTPRPPRACRPDLPPVVSDIILKLLAKVAEERYQSAVGLQHDLEFCLKQWVSEDRISDFRLAERDGSGELSIPQKLYGRGNELDVLLSTLDRASSGAKELILVSGQAGIGKSALVNELQKHIVGRCRFAAGKFDYLGRSVPYAPIAQICRVLVRSSLAEPPAVLAGVREAIVEAVGPNGQLLIELAPELQSIIGAQPAVPPLGPSESQHRFERVFLNFLRIFATREHPLVLFLDDLQWADGGSLRLLHEVLTASGLGYLLIIGAFRKNELTSVHPLTLTLDDLGRAGVRIAEIALDPLELAHVTQLVSETLACSAEDATPLGTILLEKTRGNPFFIGQFLASLHRERLLSFDRQRQAWTWNLAQVRAKLVTDNVVDFMLARLQQLPDETQEVLRFAACIGHCFDDKTLAIVSRHSRREAATRLWEALRQGLIVPLDGNYRYTDDDATGAEPSDGGVQASYRFLHDRVQEASYALIGPEERAEVHLNIGRLLLARSLHAPHDSELFEVADHLNRGASLMTDPSERRELARLNLAAGRKARDASAPESAIIYLKAALELLGPGGWTTDYEIVCPAHRIKGECEFLTGHLDEAFQSLRSVEHNARTLLERIKSRSLEIVLLTSAGRLMDACAKTIETAALLGMHLPAWNDQAALGAAIGAEFGAYQAAIAASGIGALAKLPAMTDPEQLAILEILANGIPPAFQAVPELHVLLVLKGVHMLRQAVAPLAGFFYEQYAIVHLVAAGDHATAYRFGQLGLELDRQAGDAATRAPVCFLFGGFTSHWSEHISSSLDYLRAGLRTSLEVGDPFHAVYCATFLLNYRIYAGDNLDDVQTSVASTSELVAKIGDVVTRSFGQVCQQTILALKGQTLEPGSLSTSDFDESVLASGAPLPVQAFYRAAKLLVLYMAGRYAEALATADECQPLPGLFYHGEMALYRALTMAALASAKDCQERDVLLERIRKDADTLRGWAQSGPANHAHRLALVDAELARIDGRQPDALELYDRAIALAQEHAFLHEEALANELAARFHLDHGRAKIAGVYLTEALYAYQRWGATVKVDELRRVYGRLLRGDDGARALPTAGGGPHASAPHAESDRVGTSARSGGSLDLAAMIRATEAIATELVGERLVERLMRTFIENAGAQRGVLIVERGEGLTLEAIITIEPDVVRTGLAQELTDTAELPVTLVQYVARTREPAVLADAIRDPRFASDPYISRCRPKSILCVAMLQRGRLAGVLYLENNIATNAFSPARSELLQFLASQAAVALENARLYGDLNAASEGLRRANENLAGLVAQRTNELRSALAGLWTEMDLARKIQTVLLPERSRVNEYDFAAIMLPAESVGGDYYDVIDTGDRSWIFIGDVSGHGVAAGLSMMMVQTAVRTIVLTSPQDRETLTPAVVLSRANQAVRENLSRISEDQYMTISALELERGKVRYAGLHQDILVYRAKSNRVERVETQGIWLGVQDDVRAFMQDETMNLEPGDTLLLFTDGITEFSVDGHMLGTDGLSERFRLLAVQQLDPVAIVKGLLGPLTGQAVRDDITITAVRYRPTAPVPGTASVPS